MFTENGYLPPGMRPVFVDNFVENVKNFAVLRLFSSFGDGVRWIIPVNIQERFG